MIKRSNVIPDRITCRFFKFSLNVLNFFTGGAGMIAGHPLDTVKVILF